MIFNQDSNKVLYAHYRKTDNQIFYIGYGSLTRAYDRNGRNIWWERTIRKYGFDDNCIKILAENLTEERAKELEILTIAFYGRNDKNQGPLVNLTDGGDGVTLFGSDNPSYDNTIFKFQKDEKIEVCTKYELRQKYTYLHEGGITNITIGKYRTTKGWICLNPLKEFIPKPMKKGHKLTKEHKDKISGIGASCVDMNIYTFIHIDGSVEVCHRFELRNKYTYLTKRGLYSIINGECKQTKGWKCLNPKKEYKEPIINRDNTIYFFIHKNGNIIKSTKFEFVNNFQMDMHSINRIIRGERRIHKGWICTMPIDKKEN